MIQAANAAGSLATFAENMKFKRVHYILTAAIAVLVIGFFLIYPHLRASISYKNVPEVRALGVALFGYANNNGGIYPRSLEELKVSGDFTENDIIDSPDIQYFPPEHTISTIPSDYVLLLFSFPDGSTIKYYAGNSAEFVHGKK